MTQLATTQELAEVLGDISPATIKRLPKEDKSFPTPKRVGRTNYHDLEKIPAWLKTRASNPDAIQEGDRIISGARLRAWVKRSKAWQWRNIIEPKALTRFNLGPNPKTNKLSDFYIEREVREVFSDLIAVAESNEQGVAQHG